MQNKIFTDSQSILSFLRNLPNETEREFEIQLTDLVEHTDNSILREKLITVLADEQQEEAIAYAAFYCLTISYRRTKDISLLENIVKQYESKFENSHLTYSHIYALYLKEKGIGKDVIQIIQKSYDAYTKLNKNAGVVHNFADIVATAYEESDTKIRNYIETDWLDKAQEAVELSIQLDANYAKYYCTKGRLLAIKEKYGEAIESIKRAIDLEDSSETDYVIRLGNYQYYLLMVQTKKYNSLLNNQLKKYDETIKVTKNEIDKKFQENSIKYLEFLGFFAAVVSFTIGSIQIINNQSFSDAKNLIVILFAVLLCVFSSFGILLHGFGKRTLPNAVIFGIGLIIILLFMI